MTAGFKTHFYNRSKAFIPSRIRVYPSLHLFAFHQLLHTVPSQVQCIFALDKALTDGGIDNKSDRFLQIAIDRNHGKQGDL